MQNAVANILKVHFYDANREVRVKSDASHNGLAVTLKQQRDEGPWVRISFASRYLKTQEKKYSTNKLELLVDYLLRKVFIVATDHKALTSALDGNKSNKTYQSRLIQWVDRLLPYHFKKVHISEKDMEIVDYSSRDLYNDPWPESEIDEKFAVTTINSFHKALEGMSSRLENTEQLNRKECFLECSRRNVAKQSSLSGCYGNQNGQKRAKLNRNDTNQLSRPSKQLNSSSQRKQITFSSFQPNKQSCHKAADSQKKFSESKSEKKTDSRKENAEKFNRSYDWWSDTPQEWRNEEREESILDPKWNRSFSNTNELSEEEEVTETLQRLRKIIRGSRKIGTARIAKQGTSQGSNGNYHRTNKRSGNRLLSIWQLTDGGSSTPQNIKPELVEATEESVTIPIGIVPAQPEERKLSDVQEIEVDLTTTDEMDKDQEKCAIEQPKRQAHRPKEEQKLQKQQTEDTLDNLSKLFDKSLFAELTSEERTLGWIGCDES